MAAQHRWNTQALTIRTPDQDLQAHIETQNNLAVNHHALGARIKGRLGNSHLEAAIDGYERVISFLSRTGQKVLRAEAQSNLGRAYTGLANRSDGHSAIAFLGKAEDALVAALTILTQADYRVAWAMAKNNYAEVLWALGSRSDGEAGLDLLFRARETCREALTIRTRAHDTVSWAASILTLAFIEWDWSHHSASEDPGAHLHAALVHIDAALEIFDPVHMPYDHETATTLRQRILAALDSLTNG